MKDYQTVTDAIAPAPARPVTERVLENVAAGVGVGALVSAVAWALGVPLPTWQWPAIVALAWFGLLSAIRFSLDEGRAVALAWRVGRLRVALERKTQEAAQLTDALAESRRDVAGLRAQLDARPNYVPAQPPPDDPTRADARKLVELRYRDGVAVSRSYMCRSQGLAWTEARYRDAYAMCKRAGLVEHGDWQPMEYADALQRLSSPTA